MDKPQKSRDFKILGGVLKIYNTIDTISFFSASENTYWIGKFNECIKIKNVVCKAKKFKSGSVHANFESFAHATRVLVMIPFDSIKQKHEILRITLNKCTNGLSSFPSMEVVTTAPAPQTKPIPTQPRHFSILGGTFSIIIKTHEIRFSTDGILYRAVIENDIFLTENIASNPEPGSSAIVPVRWPQQKSSICTLEFEFHSTYPRNDPEKIALTLIADYDSSESDDQYRELADNIEILSNTCEAYKNMLLASNKNLYSIVDEQKQSTSEWIRVQSSFEEYRQDSLARQTRGTDEIARLGKVISQLNCDMEACRSDRDSFIKLSFTRDQELKSKNDECRELRIAMIRLMHERDAAKSECESQCLQNSNLKNELDVTKSECESRRSQNSNLKNELDSLSLCLARAMKPKSKLKQRFINMFRR